MLLNLLKEKHLKPDFYVNKTFLYCNKKYQVKRSKVRSKPQ